TGYDAESTSMTLRRADRVGGLSPVRQALELSQERQLGEVRVIDTPNGEDVEWAHLDAIVFALTPRVIDDGNKPTGLRAALLPRPIRVCRRAAGFRGVQGFRHAPTVFGGRSRTIRA